MSTGVDICQKPSNGNNSEERKVLKGLTNKTQYVFESEKWYGVRNYDPIPVNFSRGEGIYIWDVEGKKYYDFHTSYSAVHRGQCHTKIVQDSRKQAEILPSREFYYDELNEYAQYITQLFNYDKVLLIYCELETRETACKLAVKWGYAKKKIPNNYAKIVVAERNYWGRTIAAISSTNDPSCSKHYEAFMPGFLVIPYNDLSALENTLKEDQNICAFMVEPIQDECGIIVPSTGYLKGVREICTKYNVLWIDDEVQVDLGRTGKLLAVEHEHVKPDIICLGEALPAAMMAISAVLADDSVMACMTPGEHAPRYSGNPIQCKVAASSLKLVTEGKVAENAQVLGELLKTELGKLPKSIIKEVRGKGLLYALVIKKEMGFTATDVCVRLRKNGLLAKPINDDIIRLAPSLIITKAQLKKSTKIILSTIKSFCK